MKKIIPILLVVSIFLSCCSFGNNEKNSGAISKASKYSGKIHILLYFPDSTGSYLVPVDRIVDFDISLEKTIMNEILRGPLSPSLLSPVPSGTKLLSISRNGDTVTVNLSSEFKKNHPGGAAMELMSIYTIVDSLTEIPGVKWVLFKINGKPEDTLTGHITFNKPIGRNRGLLKRNKSLSPKDALNLQMTLESQGKWLDAYVMLSDIPDNPDRKYFSDYFVEMEEVRQLGFTDQKFQVGDYTLNESGNKARVRVDFYSLNPYGSKNIINTSYFNTVKVEGVWMVDWSTVQ